jgi:hypothetical protein
MLTPDHPNRTPRTLGYNNNNRILIAILLVFGAMAVGWYVYGGLYLGRDPTPVVHTSSAPVPPVR